MEEDETRTTQKGQARSTGPQRKNVEREGVGKTTQIRLIDDSKTTKHDKTRYSIEGGEKIPSDMEYCMACMACMAQRKVDPDGTKMTRSDTTGEERNLSNTAENVEKFETYTKVETDKTQRTLSDQAGEERNRSNASDKGEQVETWDYFNSGKLDRPQRKTALVDRKESGPILATRKRTETWRTRRRIAHWWSALLVALKNCTTDIVQARVDRHQNLSSRHCPNKLSVLTVRNGCNGAHSGTWEKIGNITIRRSGGDDLLRRSATWARGERQLRHRRNGEKHEAWTGTRGTSSERQQRNRMESKSEQRRRDKHVRVKLGKRSLAGWIRGDGYGSGGTEYYKCKMKKTNEHGIIEGGVRPNEWERFDEWVCDRYTKRNFMIKAEYRRCKAPPNEAQRNE